MGDPQEGGGDDDASDSDPRQARAGAGRRADTEGLRTQDLHLGQRGHAYGQLSKD